MMHKSTKLVGALVSGGVIAAGIAGITQARSAPEAAATRAPSPAAFSPVEAQPTGEDHRALAAAAPDGPIDLPGFVMMGGLSSSQVSDAIESRIAECMRRQGYQYVVVKTNPTTPRDRALLREYRAEFGYGVTKNPPLHDANADLVRLLSPEQQDLYRIALEGTPRGDGQEPGGCVAEALESVGAEVPAIRPDADELNLRVSEVLAPHRSAILSAEERYSSCMAASGYEEIPAPMSAAIAAEKLTSFADEISLAAADIECQELYMWPMWDLLGPELAPELEALVGMQLNLYDS